MGEPMNNSTLFYKKEGNKIGNFKVYRSFDKFLKDPNISLRTKGFLTMVLTNNINTGFEVEKYCYDTKEDIKDALLELRIAKYIRYNSETNMLELNTVSYDKCNEEEYEL